MKKKELAIATIDRHTGIFLANAIKNIFQDDIIIRNYCFEKRNMVDEIRSDLVIILEELIFEAVKKYVKNDAEIITAKRTLSKKGFEKIKDLSPGTEAMLVNMDREMAMETISLIYELGVKEIELTPVYPGMNDLPDLALAITPGETDYVPDKVKQIIDIGDRVLDISAIIDIAVKLELESILDNERIKRYFDNIMPISFGLEKIIGKSSRLESKLDILLQSLDVGIIGTGPSGIISSFNKSAERITGLSKDMALGKDAKQLFSKIPFDKSLNYKKSTVDKIVREKNRDLVVTINPIVKFDSIYGAVAIVKSLDETVKKQHKIRAQLVNKGHVAKYIFEDICGDSDEIIQAKKIAERMAVSNSTILIIGESGTGKELFAQAIHNNSSRKKKQFVAVNCAALPESLLESELFGYEKGAFTGAKTEGKMGLFELAHQGTLFLDEISELPLRLQSRLLRVLEEREVMRVGGDTVINIDVRIIVATNRNIIQLVSDGKFREDLYYRLSILPLKIPPLNERKGDIPELIERFKTELKANFTISKEVINKFLKHSWPGNVRELRNYIEYFSNLQKDVIDIKDLPFTLLEKNRTSVFRYEKDLEKTLNEIKEEMDNKHLYILETLERKRKNNERAGRRSIAEEAVGDGLFITEQEIRSIFDFFARHQLVEINRGRGGTVITEKGQKVLKILIKED